MTGMRRSGKQSAAIGIPFKSFRRYRGDLLGSGRSGDNNTESNGNGDDDSWTYAPIDTDEQEILIQKFELKNYQRNQRTVNILSLSYLFCAGLFLILMTKVRRNIGCILMAGIQSIICSCITLRYDLINDFAQFNRFKLQIKNSTLDMLNVIILILITWITFNNLKDANMSLYIFLQIPLLLFIVTQLVKKWDKDMTNELRDLRHLKYQYKNA